MHVKESIGRSFHAFLGSFMQKSHHSTHSTTRNIPESPKIPPKIGCVHTYIHTYMYIYMVHVHYLCTHVLHVYTHLNYWTHYTSCHVWMCVYRYHMCTQVHVCMYVNVCVHVPHTYTWHTYTDILVYIHVYSWILYMYGAWNQCWFIIK